MKNGGPFGIPVCLLFNIKNFFFSSLEWMQCIMTLDCFLRSPCWLRCLNSARFCAVFSPPIHPLWLIFTKLHYHYYSFIFPPLCVCFDYSGAISHRCLLDHPLYTGLVNFWTSFRRPSFVFLDNAAAL